MLVALQYIFVVQMYVPKTIFLPEQFFCKSTDILQIHKIFLFITCFLESILSNLRFKLRILSFFFQKQVLFLKIV